MLALLAAGCGPAPAGATPTLTVFAAASLSGAFAELATRFEAAHPGTTVVLNLAGSQQLAQQLAQGAPADVFASAGEPEMQQAVAAGRVAAGSARLFATNRLVAVAAAGAGEVRDLSDLARPGVTLVLAAPEVPAGRHAQDFLDRAAADPAYGPGYRLAVLANVASYEANVRAVLNKVALGEAGAGIVYASDLHGAPPHVLALPIPEALNPIAAYPIAVVADSQQPALAQAFVEMVLSPEGQRVMRDFGFGGAR
jgi:molybdate transport system substrate-binding protein